MTLKLPLVALVALMLELMALLTETLELEALKAGEQQLVCSE